MPKCPECRKNDLELLTRWERFKEWALYKLFPKEIVDICQNHFTQGFGDGLEKGREVERRAVREMVKKIYNIDL